MKEQNLNVIKTAAEEMIHNCGASILEIIDYEDYITWLTQAYTLNDRTKEYTARFNAGQYGDVTIITTARRLSIIDNSTSKSSWMNSNYDLCEYQDLIYDLMSLNVMANWVYQRLLVNNS